MSQKIEVYYDEQAGVTPGWAYRIDGGASGAIDGDAADAIDRICENIEPHDSDYDDLRDAIGFRDGDQAYLDLGPGSYIDLEQMLTNV